MKLRMLLCCLILPLFAYADQYKTTNITINSYHLTAEICETLPQQIKGLQNHKPLTHHDGMLFVYDHEAVRYFWMKNMSFPIDIIWIDKNHRVASINHSVPVCTQFPCDIYQPNKPILYVLETKAGLAKEKGVKPGTLIKFDIPQSSNKIIDAAHEQKK